MLLLIHAGFKVKKAPEVRDIVTMNGADGGLMNENH